MLIFHDWEFVEDGFSIASISVGLVAEDGREYYAIFNDRRTMTRAVTHPWLRDNVVCHLPIIAPAYPSADGWSWDPSHPDFKHVKRRSVIAVEVLEFFRGTPDAELRAWYAAFDHVALAWLYGSMIELPAGIPMWTGDLRHDAERLGNPRVPKQIGPEHHALHDARHDRDIHQYLTQYQRPLKLAA